MASQDATGSQPSDVQAAPGESTRDIPAVVAAFERRLLKEFATYVLETALRGREMGLSEKEQYDLLSQGTRVLVATAQSIVRDSPWQTRVTKPGLAAWPEGGTEPLPGRPPGGGGEEEGDGSDG